MVWIRYDGWYSLFQKEVDVETRVTEVGYDEDEDADDAGLVDGGEHDQVIGGMVPHRVVVHDAVSTVVNTSKVAKPVEDVMYARTL